MSLRPRATAPLSLSESDSNASAIRAAIEHAKLLNTQFELENCNIGAGQKRGMDAGAAYGSRIEYSLEVREFVTPSVRENQKGMVKLRFTLRKRDQDGELAPPPDEIYRGLIDLRDALTARFKGTLLGNFKFKSLNNHGGTGVLNKVCTAPHESSIQWFFVPSVNVSPGEFTSLMQDSSKWWIKDGSLSEKTVGDLLDEIFPSSGPDPANRPLGSFNVVLPQPNQVQERVARVRIITLASSTDPKKPRRN